METIVKAPLTPSDLDAINALAKAQLTEDQIYTFAVRLCDNEVDRDFERFPRTSLETLAKLFVGKSGIFDHVWSAQGQAARLYKTEVVEELGQTIFSSSDGDSKSAEELFRTDYKEFHIAGHNLAVSQITCMDSEHLLQRRSEFLQVMESVRREKDFNMVILMITDVLLEGTQLLFVGDVDAIRQAFNAKDTAETVFLPKVMSRKKQVIPMLSALWG